jgi:hypothetical protein
MSPSEICNHVSTRRTVRCAMRDIRHFIGVALLTLCGMPVAFGSTTDESARALLSDAARSHTYMGSMTTRWRHFLETEVPEVSLYLGMSEGGESQPLLYAVAATTAQGQPMERPDGSIVVASCRPGSCEEKGMIWVSKDGVVVGAIVHFYYRDPKAAMSPSLLIWSRDVNAEAVPHGFVMALTEWLRQPVTLAGFKTLRMVGRDGKITELTGQRILP